MDPLLSHIVNLHVLIVDDVDSMRSELKSILKDLGFKNISEAENGEVALSLAFESVKNGKNIDIIFTDLKMPTLGGVQLLKSLRAVAAYKSIPIFIISVENEKSLILKCIVAGATEYILKPFDPEVIKSKLIEKVPKPI